MSDLKASKPMKHAERVQANAALVLLKRNPDLWARLGHYCVDARKSKTKAVMEAITEYLDRRERNEDQD